MGGGIRRHRVMGIRAASMDEEFPVVRAIPHTWGWGGALLRGPRGSRQESEPVDQNVASALLKFLGPISISSGDSSRPEETFYWEKSRSSESSGASGCDSSRSCFKSVNVHFRVRSTAGVK